ncbi:MAG: hypothetical protein DWQ34_08825 [Planctomycetota bacterium]|nr:MAG: hypothetical protein DWQ29_03780 [Planctomycetota bacterium]REJ94300.1 MAG: hypothetical protein DWQ34_08825 [Planctomycetota bacterium]REK23171.1 MAG: hypothetical protein DWQ41_17230 [Planctomycetota bacterium]REK30914.1 MAG: hypothetical protein DWQ45_20975 [Planctomycetota bacterium]
MKRFLLFSVCLTLMTALTGCCCMGPCGGNPCASPCGPGGCNYNPYGPYGSAVAPTTAYHAGVSVQAAATPYAPTYAAAPVNVLPTY